MPVTTAQLATQVGTSVTRDAEVLTRTLATANSLVSTYAGSATIPDTVLDEAVLAVAAEVFSQRNAPNGVLNQQYPSADGGGLMPVRIGADPLRPAYPLLALYVDPVTFA